MSLEKNISIDKYEIVGEYRIIQIRELITITENGNQISKSYHRRTINPLSDTTNESEEIRNIAASVHTQTIRDAYQSFMNSVGNGE